jgi:putative endopeptidase
MEDLRDPYANYNKMKFANLNNLCPSVNWDNYLIENGIGKSDSVIVGQPAYYQALNKLLNPSNLDTWKSLMRYRLTKRFSEVLPDKFGQLAFEFSKLFSGAKQRKPRWKRVIRAEENAMGELLGQLYVKEFFNEKAKQRYEKMVEDVKLAYSERIKNLNWMGDTTKQKALIKLAAVKMKVGYPNKWKDFSSMEIVKDSYFQNVVNSSKWWHQYQVNKLGKPVDRDEWDMTPQTYNAYYNPSNNEIVLPAGIFTIPGYKDEELDDATVYGYAGASTIGHEITHGFDDKGRLYYSDGNLNDWWTELDTQRIEERSKKLEELFNKFSYFDININGKLTLGENIADLGGVSITLDCLKDVLYQHPEMNYELELNNFFKQWAIIWRNNIRPDEAKKKILTDPHSPGCLRVNGILKNIDDFYTIFNINENDNMYIKQENRCLIW